MAISRQSLDSIPTSFASVSVGTPDDPLPQKLEAISAAGFRAIELGLPDLVSFASAFHKKDVQQNDYESLCSAGTEVAKICTANKLSIMMLQPFGSFEGWPKGSKERADAFGRARGWIKIMQAVGTDMLQVGSSAESNISSSFEDLASDLRELAGMLSAQNFKLAYENWCWATRASTWKDVWEIVDKVGRPNVGLCLDTFQTAGGEWADPTTKSGLIETYSSKEELERKFHDSLAELARTVPKDKIYLLQISDAYRPIEPLEKSGVQRPRGRWSQNYRPLPFSGGYLPVVDVAKAVLKTGTRCWFSYEVFDGGPEGKETREYDFGDFTKAAMASHGQLLDKCAN
ncbi:MAG: hypothetical protein M1818_001266 [Claussenomyces sp. TS43310]|nr:MAG: hypothetical protein M1818_001266 [Claussenomyces sp. TS43310]